MKPPLKPGQHRRAPLPRGTKRPKRGGIERSRERIRQVGRKGLENARALRAFKRECARLGLERCEVRYAGCTGEPDTWAHGRKRRLLKPGELETFAVIACLRCHRKLDEGMSHEGMADEVARIIAGRADRQTEAA